MAEEIKTVMAFTVSQLPVKRKSGAAISWLFTILYSVAYSQVRGMKVLFIKHSFARLISAAMSSSIHELHLK